MIRELRELVYTIKIKKYNTSKKKDKKKTITSISIVYALRVSNIGGDSGIIPPPAKPSSLLDLPEGK